MIAYRRLLPTEAPELTAHLRRLPREDRALRFFSAISDEAIGVHVDGIDWTRMTVIGAFKAGQLRGAAELFLKSDDGDLAISVEPEFQHTGIGTELLSRGLLAARNRGIHNVHMQCLTVNEKMRHLASKFEPRLQHASGEAVAEIHVPSRSRISLAREAAGEVFGWLGDTAGRFAKAQVEASITALP